ncbi:GyrI-like domain-containing protein [Bacillus marasmi]|uniref:GyrI-like domain-containing protein n=1 Tax=Bacillus marasmi TaxID=1926279 RepID=UPI0011CCDA0B|nr:GyrI-like domain-containing protein [Bacillus marasmi]
MVNEKPTVKIDYKKELRNLYNPPKKIGLIDVPTMNYLMIDGKGNPNTSEDFQAAIEALYSVSYNLKFTSKNAGLDYVVMPLEALWYMDNYEDFLKGQKDDWQWTAMIMQPEPITKEMVEEAIETIRKKKNPAALDKLRFEAYDEGRSVQVLYVGPFDDEHPTIMKMHEFAAENGYVPSGKHHEIYLSDFRKVDPSKLKTVIRQPVAPK